jgi:two-component system cell cycle sensor histidine kinase/response regulator CckA
MATALRVLIVEDCEPDAELLVATLEAADYQVVHQRVQTADAMRAALGSGQWDIVISDYNLPNFDAPAALRVLQSAGLDLPFIIVSGMVGEDTAVAALKAGANDFMVKGRLARLGPAIERALREAEGRRERAQLQEQLVQAQKLEAVGRLAGGVAHDFNNVLTAILGFAEMMLSEVDPATTLYMDLSEIKSAGQRAAGLTRQLLAFSRQQIVQAKLVDVNARIEEMRRMLRLVVAEHIDLRLALASSDIQIMIDPTQLEQILINLVINAADAMPRGGTVTVETARATLDANYRPQRLPVSPGEYLRLTVRDTGTGMDEGTLQRMFEPFFTTKAVGKGTGLGLATVYGIVKQCGGDIVVSSRVNQGSGFTIYLPLVEAPAALPVDETRHKAPSATRSATILLVEDDQAVRQFARIALERAGYRVLQAGSPIEAMRVANEFNGPIQLLLSDIVLPDSNGLGLFERLKPNHAQLLVLYMSGYADESLFPDGLVLDPRSFLQKPFSSSDLTRKVREVLDAGAGAPSALEARAPQSLPSTRRTAS